MPIEIRELVIKATVNNKDTRTSDSGSSPEVAEPLINEIVDRVFRILEQKQHR
ncbi:hypothetical protein KUV50_01095 [Membranicola marinus]|uniref:Uncharacterized protein n=1 Tax=Membranihabitans marinus TaxID=1227546 RepID=A0A953L9J3_9BACT|nr:DUF5908 family protein [Membranihabitans marinus]MBY5956711.1 hypothetical protein [Membranihabitans marinus]